MKLALKGMGATTSTVRVIKDKEEGRRVDVEEDKGILGDTDYIPVDDDAVHDSESEIPPSAGNSIIVVSKVALHGNRKVQAAQLLLHRATKELAEDVSCKAIRYPFMHKKIWFPVLFLASSY